jgi:uncharacterized RDD family membrane protein YckC
MMMGVSAETAVEDKIVLRRYLQYGVDRLLVIGASVVTLILGLLVAFPLIMAGAPKFVIYVPFGAFILMLIVGDLLVDVWTPHKRDGATPGMLLFDLRIVSTEGKPLAVRDYLVRWALSVVDGLFLGLVGALLIAFTPRHQRMGDIVARTVVVRPRGRCVHEDHLDSAGRA